MNDFEKQSLENDIQIMRALRCLNIFREIKHELLIRGNESIDLLNPKREPTLKERTHDALCEEVKKE